MRKICSEFEAYWKASLIYLFLLLLHKTNDKGSPALGLFIAMIYCYRRKWKAALLSSKIKLMFLEKENFLCSVI